MSALQKRIEAAEARVEKLLVSQPIWQVRSAAWIARKARVSQHLAAKVRRRLLPAQADPEVIEYQDKNGRVTRMDASRIGKRRPAPKTPSEGLAMIAAAAGKLTSRAWRATAKEWFRLGLIELADLVEKTAALVRQVE